MVQSLDLNEKIERATEITFRRLHQLVQRAYTPDFSASTELPAQNIVVERFGFVTQKKSGSIASYYSIRQGLLYLQMRSRMITASIVMMRRSSVTFFGRFPNRHSGR